MMPSNIPPEIAEDVTRLMNGLITKLNGIDGIYRNHAAIALMMHLADQVFTYGNNAEVSFLLMTKMLTKTYQEAMSSEGKTVQ
jgi:hypothetical protein